MTKIQAAAAVLSGEHLFADDVATIADNGDVTLRHEWSDSDQTAVAQAVMTAAVKAAKVEAVLHEHPVSLRALGGELISTVSR